MLIEEQLKTAFIYEPETGLIRWNCRPNIFGPIHVGDRAGKITHGGYVIVTHKGKHYLAHRLAWLIQTGEWPKGVIDHINGNGLDNRIENLRDVSSGENQLNRAKHRAGRPRGVTFHKQSMKWQAVVPATWHPMRERVYLGLFVTASEAGSAITEYVKGTIS